MVWKLLKDGSHWERTHMVGSTRAPSYGPGVVYKRAFPAGNISIMGNEGGGHGNFYCLHVHISLSLSLNTYIYIYIYIHTYIYIYMCIYIYIYIYVYTYTYHI